MEPPAAPVQGHPGTLAQAESAKCRGPRRGAGAYLEEAPVPVAEEEAVPPGVAAGHPRRGRGAAEWAAVPCPPERKSARSLGVGERSGITGAGLGAASAGLMENHAVTDVINDVAAAGGLRLWRHQRAVEAAADVAVRLRGSAVEVVAVHRSRRRLKETGMDGPGTISCERRRSRNPRKNRRDEDRHHEEPNRLPTHAKTVTADAQGAFRNTGPGERPPLARNPTRPDGQRATTRR
jgi:hypothetical protein